MTNFITVVASGIPCWTCISRMTWLSTNIACFLKRQRSSNSGIEGNKALKFQFRNTSDKQNIKK